MNSSQASTSSSVAKLLADARGWLARNDYPQALQLLQRARGLDPKNDKVFLELGRVYTLCYDFASADRCFETAIHVSNSKVDVLLTVGHHWMEIRHFEAATRYFEQALCFNPPPLVALARLAEMYGRLRRLDDAAAITERALREYPHHEAALLARGKVLRQLRQYEEAELLFLQILSNPAHPIEARAVAGYELAAVLDARECYEEAMDALVEAKALLRGTATPMLRMFRDKQAQMRDLSSAVTPKVVERWRQTGRTDLQPERKIALLCGYPRSGTTMLEYIIDSHPEVVSADETSVFHNKIYYEISRNLSPSTRFSSVIDSMSPRTLRQVRSEYVRGIESFLGQPVGERLLMDKNPSMTFDIPAMVRVFPESKFLVALRDPRDVCVSCFMQAWPMLPDTIPWLTPEGSVENYAAVMGMWLAIKPAVGDSALEVRYEDLVQDLEPNARKTLGFLNLPWNDRVLRFNENAQSKVVRSPTYVEVAKPVYKTSMGRWRNYQKYFEQHFEKLAPFLKAFGYSIVTFFCLIRSAGILMIFWLLMSLSVLRVSGAESEGRPAQRRTSPLTRRSSTREESLRVVGRSGIQFA